MSARIETHALTAERWKDFETLFGARGACGGCWCMWWRVRRSEFERMKGEPNRRAIRKLVRHGEPPGILGYVDGEPVGWCAVGPREDYPVLDRSRVLARVDDAPVWSVTCFFVRKDRRRSGVSRALLEAAVRFARERGATGIEGYPVAPKGDSMPDVFAFTGLPATFLAAGFRECARRSPTRPIMRRRLRPGRR